MTACGAVGALVVGGKVVGQIACDQIAGHDDEMWLDSGALLTPEEYAAHNRAGGWALPRIEPTPHSMTLTWEPEADPDLDLFDPDEHFDAVVPIVDTGICLVPGCAREANHAGLHDITPDD